MPLCAAPCRCSQSRSCKYALFLTPPPLCQRGGRGRHSRMLRRCELGLVLQHSRAPSRCYAEGLSVCGDCSALGAVWVLFGVRPHSRTAINCVAVY